MRLLLVAVSFVVASLAASGCSSSSDEPSAPVIGAGVVSRIEISPRGALLVPAANSQTFSAKAFDAEGKEVSAAFTWTSNAPDVIAVDAAGTSTHATALKSTGSAIVTVEAGGMKSSVFAVAAEPAPNTVLLRDDQISALPRAIDPAAPFGPGFRYRVELVGPVSAAVGMMALSTGDKTVAGRIVAADGASITVEQVTLDEILPRLDIRQRIDLTTVSSGEPGVRAQALRSGLRPLAEKEFKIGPLECKVEGSLGALELTKKDIAVAPLEGLFYEVVWTDTERKIVVSGKPTVTFELEAKATGSLQGKVDCKARLRDYTIPLPGPIGIFLGAAVPLGLGFEVGAKAVLTDIGVNFKGSASANVSIGFQCTGSECVGITEADAEGTVTPRFIPPQLDLLDTRFEPSAQVYAWVKLEGGARFESTLRFEAIEAQGGVKLEGTLAGEKAQAKADDYASSYKASFALAAGPSGAAETFLKLVKVAVALLQFSKEIPIGASPAGKSLVASQQAFKAGDTVTFSLKLDPASVKFPVVGYNVESVRIYRKEGTSLILANEVLPQGEQVDFEIPWVATLDGEVGSSFVAFVKTKLVDPRLEVATSASGSLGEITQPTGVKFPALDSYSYVDPDGPGAQNTPVSISAFFYSSLPGGVIACTKQEVKPSSQYFEVQIYDPETGIAPGSHTYGAGAGKFRVFHRIISASPTCTTEGTPRIFQAGTLTVSGVTPAGYSGTFSVMESDGATTTGTFSTIPRCAKTEAEGKAFILKCTP